MKNLVMSHNLSPHSSRSRDKTQLLKSTLFSLYSFPTVYTDIMLDMMTRKQNEFVDIPLVPHKESKLDFPDIFDANRVLLYFTSSSGTVASLSLFVPMSPGFGESIFLRVNHCTTDVAAIRKKLIIKVIEREEKLSRTICIED